MSAEPKYGHVRSSADVTAINREIRRLVRGAASEERLTKLFRQSGYLATLSQSGAWRDMHVVRVARLEFNRTAKVINARAKKLGIVKRYDETYG